MPDRFAFLHHLSKRNSLSAMHMSQDDYQLAQSLRKEGLVSVSKYGDFSITSKGLSVLDEHDRRLKQKAENQARKRSKQHADEAEAERLRIQDIRRSWWQFWLGLLLGWILGGFTFQDFWNLISH